MYFNRIQSDTTVTIVTSDYFEEFENSTTYCRGSETLAPVIWRSENIDGWALPQFLIQHVWVGAQEFSLLTSFQVMLILLPERPYQMYFENHGLNRDESSKIKNNKTLILFWKLLSPVYKTLHNLERCLLQFPFLSYSIWPIVL